MTVQQLSLGIEWPQAISETEVQLPMAVSRVYVPPVKCQGIKTRLVPFILSSIRWNGHGRWIEPFVGSGVVAFNLAPPRALLAETNVHLITLYHDIASGVVTAESVREHLRREGRRLAQRGEEHYYEVRSRFNANPSSLDFIFLNRSCFNGVIRFNKKGQFNVPFGKKRARFRPAYVTKIANQVAYLSNLISARDWVFQVSDWRETLDHVQPGDFVYVDPPYIGRHTDYYDRWTEDDASELFRRLLEIPAGFALSTWKENKYRRNPHLDTNLPGVTIKTMRHFYYVGSTEDLRNEMEEALVIRNGFAAA